MGWPSVEEGLKNISSRELTEWMEYYKLEPFGEDRADNRMGILAATIANVNRSRKQKAFKPEDFIPKYGEDEPTPEQKSAGWLKLIEEMNKAMGGQDLREGRGNDNSSDTDGVPRNRPFRVPKGSS